MLYSGTGSLESVYLVDSREMCVVIDDSGLKDEGGRFEQSLLNIICIILGNEVTRNESSAAVYLHTCSTLRILH